MRPFLLKLMESLSGWQDSNLRPPAPKAGAITGLRYTPRQNLLSGETGTRTLATVTRRQISNLLHYRSGTSPSSEKLVSFCGCKFKTTLYISQVFRRLFSIFFHLFLKSLHYQTNTKKIFFLII